MLSSRGRELEQEKHESGNCVCERERESRASRRERASQQEQAQMKDTL